MQNDFTFYYHNSLKNNNYRKVKQENATTFTIEKLEESIKLWGAIKKKEREREKEISTQFGASMDHPIGEGLGSRKNWINFCDL